MKHIITQDELDDLVRLHELWLINDPNGRRFDVNACIFRNVSITKKILIKSIWRKCVFVDLTLKNVNLEYSIFYKIKFVQFNCENVTLNNGTTV